MDLVFGYLAGLLTLVNPCVLPVLPVILISALNADRLGPLALVAGMGITFVTLGIAVASIGPAFGVDDLLMSKIASVLMIVFGVILLVPQFSSRFALAASGSANSASIQLNEMDTSGLREQFITGMLLGAVWSPCIGPTLGGAISLAAEGKNLIWAAMIMVSFAIGIGTIIVSLSYGAREILIKRQATLRVLAEKARPISGVIMIVLGVTIFFSMHHIIEIWLLDNMPAWLLDFSVIL